MAGCYVQVTLGCLGPCAAQLGCCPWCLLGSHKPCSQRGHPLQVSETHGSGFRTTGKMHPYFPHQQRSGQLLHCIAEGGGNGSTACASSGGKLMKESRRNMTHCLLANLENNPSGSSSLHHPTLKPRPARKAKQQNIEDPSSGERTTLTSFRSSSKILSQTAWPVFAFHRKWPSAEEMRISPFAASAARSWCSGSVSSRSSIFKVCKSDCSCSRAASFFWRIVEIAFGLGVLLAHGKI